jgi:hypothetical protein
MASPATDFRVNSDTLFNQNMPVTATLTDGSFVVVWTSADSAGQATVKYQRFDGQGNAIGAETMVAAGAALYEPPSVARLNDGGFVVSWQTYGADIHMQRFAANGAPVGGETQVNPDAAPVQHQNNEAVTGLNDGGWFVTWRSEIDTSGYQTVFGQRYDANGAAVGGTSIVESMNVSIGNAVTTSLFSGGYVVVWTHNDELLQRRYDAGGQPAGDGSPQTVAALAGNPPHVAALADGGWIVLYPGDQSTLYAQRFDSTGHTVGGPAAIAPAVSTSFHQGATATGLANGGYVITWESWGTTPGQADIHAQRFDATGARVGDEIAVNTFTDSAQIAPSVSALQDGGFMITWASTLQDGSGTGVYAKRFDANGVPQSNTGWLDGDAGNDFIQWDGAQPGRLSGWGGNDTLVGGPGNDIIDGGAGNDQLRVGNGNDSLNGGWGVDTALFDMTTAGITGYAPGSYAAATVSTADGTFALSQVERAQFANGLFALDTQAPINFSWPGGNTWWAAALFHLGFGVLPGREDLSRWTAQADQLGTPTALAQAMLDTYAPGISNRDLVVHLYQQVAHTAPSEAEVQFYLSQMPPTPPSRGGPWFPTQADFVVYVAQHPLSEAGLVGFAGSVQELDAAWF